MVVGRQHQAVIQSMIQSARACGGLSPVHSIVPVPPGTPATSPPDPGTRQPEAPPHPTPPHRVASPAVFLATPPSHVGYFSISAMAAMVAGGFPPVVTLSNLGVS